MWSVPGGHIRHRHLDRLGRVGMYLIFLTRGIKGSDHVML